MHWLIDGNGIMQKDTGKGDGCLDGQIETRRTEISIRVTLFHFQWVRVETST